MTSDKRIVYLDYVDLIDEDTGNTVTEQILQVITPAPAFTGTLEQIASEVIPKHIEDYKIVGVDALPDRVFRNAWKVEGDEIKEDLAKSKVLCHKKRRRSRDAEMKPFDDIIAKQIPGKNAGQAAVERQKLRNKYALDQAEIDEATDINVLKEKYRAYSE